MSISLLITSCTETPKSLKLTLLDVDTMDKGILVVYKDSGINISAILQEYKKNNKATLEYDTWQSCMIRTSYCRLPDYPIYWDRLLPLLAQ